MSVEYPPEFWKRAFELASDGAKQCEKCHTFTIRKGEGRCTVRVVMAEPGKPMVHKLRLLCTRCLPDAREVKVPPKKLAALVAVLFDSAPEEKERKGGRKTHTSAEA
jgi:hypothetical protein